MTCMEFYGSAMYLVMAVVVVLIIFWLVRGPMRRLLSMNSRLRESSAFFSRTLLVVLLLVSLALVAGKTFSLTEDSAFMEYVWAAAGDLNGVLGLAAVVLGGYVIIMTILVVGLGRHRDE